MTATLNCIVVHPNFSVRQVVKNVLEAFGWTTNLEGSLSGALEKIRSLDGFELICLSLRFDKKMVSSWIETAKSTMKGRYSVYSALASKEDRSSPNFEIFVRKHFDIDISENITKDSFGSIERKIRTIVNQKQTERAIDDIRRQLSRIINAVDLMSQSALRNTLAKSDLNWRFLESIHYTVANSPPQVKYSYIDLIKNELITRARPLEEDENPPVQSPKPKVHFLVKKF